MPQHSASSHLSAYKDSDELAESSTYPLGQYSFEVFAQDVAAENITTIFARCYKNGELVAQKGKDFPLNTQILSWHVEANEATADIYAQTNQPGVNPWNMEPFTPAVVTSVPYAVGWSHVYSIPVHAVKYSRSYYIAAASSFFTEDNQQGTIARANYWTYDGKTVYYQWNSDNGRSDLPEYDGLTDGLGQGWQGKTAWQMIYGSFENEQGETLIARFAIDLHDAGGTGPDSDWHDPGDWNADPSTVLQLTVTGATSGRHNDPLHDTSVSYTPAKNTAKAGYGCGGAGGHGGGGGAGASTVIVESFGTNRANSKEINTIAKGHGYGSGGGKGGKGGDGCILIYY